MTLATSFATHAADFVLTLGGVYTLVLIAYVITMMAFSIGLRIPYTRASDAVLTFLRDVSEPCLRVFRRVLPSFGGWDFSPLIAIIVVQAAARVIASAIRP